MESTIGHILRVEDCLRALMGRTDRWLERQTGSGVVLFNDLQVTGIKLKAFPFYSSQMAKPVTRLMQKSPNRKVLSTIISKQKSSQSQTFRILVSIYPCTCFFKFYIETWTMPRYTPWPSHTLQNHQKTKFQQCPKVPQHTYKSIDTQIWWQVCTEPATWSLFWAERNYWFLDALQQQCHLFGFN